MVMIIHWIFLVLVLWTVPSTSLTCYKCECTSFNISACNCSNGAEAEEGAHCTIVEDFDPLSGYLELSSVLLNSSYARIKDPYYIIVDESIFYNETSGLWQTTTKRVVYGCDWDYCNTYALISYLPDTFKLIINSTWLSENIYGNGSVNSCHNCSDGICGNETQSIDYDLCSYTSCGSSTTCSLRDLWQDTETNELCYSSECTPSESADEDDEKYKVQIEAIVYLAQNRSTFDIWELDINCAVDNCSRPTIFQEIQPLIQGEVGDLTNFPTDRPTTTASLPENSITASPLENPTTASPLENPTTASPLENPTTASIPENPTTALLPENTTTSTAPVEPTITCYSCYCVNDPICACNETLAQPADGSYCTIIREYDGEDFYIILEHIDLSSSRAYIRDFPFVLVEETIYYTNTTGSWINRPSVVVYGCNSDYCNHPSLIPYLPITFQMTLNETWLNSSVLGTGQPQRECHQCPEAPQCGTTDFLDSSRCPIESCNTTCFVADTFDDPLSNELCYQSYCIDELLDEYDIYRHLVEIEGIVYGNTPGYQLELWEIDIYCRADDCSRPEIFNELREQLVVDLGDLSILNMTVITTTPSPPVGPTITCYECYCYNDRICACNETLAQPADESYCTIIREYDGEDVWIILEHIDRNSSRAYIRDFPFVLVEESIYYTNTTGNWTNRPTLVVYGCNWDYCNAPGLIPYLPITFQMTLNETWLNSSVLGTGQPQRECHQCPEAPQCGTTDFLDSSRCPIQSCNTTCFVADTFDDPLSNELCYQSYCLNEQLDEYDIYRHLVEIEGIVYGNTPGYQLELWEIDIYCRADDCSRPEIFNELREQLVVDLGDLSILNITAVTTTPSPPVGPTITCYECFCFNDPICACNETLAQPADESYCTIIREYDGEDVWIILEHIDRSSSRVYIRDFPFVLVEESIYYTNTTGNWTNRPTLVVYGCNWDYCNAPSLIPYLPITFQMTLNETWLNSSVLGTGQPQRECHQCPEAPQCGTTDFLDSSRCPIQSCNTTCFVADTFDDPLSNELCYQSYCLNEQLDEYDIYRHLVEIEGIVYGNTPDPQLELWEIDIYCRADDCSRPEIFNELREQLLVDLGDLSILNITAVTTTPSPPVGPTITCYECFCYDDPICACNQSTTVNASRSYCTIIRQDYDDAFFFIALEPIGRNSTRVYIREFPFLLAEESIIYNDSTTQWNTRTNLVMYGCNWDYCNDPSLVPYLPNSFQMRLNETWLNTNVLGTGEPVRNCHQCPDAPVCSTTDFIDGNLCPISACNTTCLVSDTFDDPDSNLQCYQSYCAPPDSEFFTIDPHRVELEGILYLYPMGRPVELWEVDVFCRGNDCSRPTIFDEIKDQLTAVLGDISAFYNMTTPQTSSTTTGLTPTASGSTTTSSSSTVSSGLTTSSSSTVSSGLTTSSSSTSPSSPATTTASTGASTYVTHAILILLFLTVSLLNSQ